MEDEPEPQADIPQDEPQIEASNPQYETLMELEPKPQAVIEAQLQACKEVESQMEEAKIQVQACKEAKAQVQAAKKDVNAANIEVEKEPDDEIDLEVCKIVEDVVESSKEEAQIEACNLKTAKEVASDMNKLHKLPHPQALMMVAEVAMEMISMPHPLTLG
ncbi:hypothetical protein PIB30_073750 [Stylosanthes scabra]|uniref:Uncharacterized protein n=1 Tax=Stylosanthes scabra TaxID=79078 RepID=A0ABU6XMD9_9FABA|nr:hypothetical protein [Stylosanthes scabra]